MAVTTDEIRRSILERVEKEREERSKAQAARQAQAATQPAGATATATVEKAKKPYKMKKGGKDEQLVKFLTALSTHEGKLIKNPFDYHEVAAMMKTRSGEPMKPESLRSQWSKISNYLESRNVDPKRLSLITPQGIGEGGQGRRSAPEVAPDELAALLGGDLEIGEGDEGEDEGEE